MNCSGNCPKTILETWLLLQLASYLYVIVFCHVFSYRQRRKAEAEKAEIQTRLQSEISELKSNVTTIQTVSIFFLLFWIIKDGLLSMFENVIKGFHWWHDVFGIQTSRSYVEFLNNGYNSCPKPWTNEIFYQHGSNLAKGSECNIVDFFFSSDLGILRSKFHLIQLLSGAQNFVFEIPEATRIKFHHFTASPIWQKGCSGTYIL